VDVPADGTYVGGQNLDFTVNFSEAVTVNTTGGTPYIPVTLDTGTVNAVYASGSGTTLLFRYTVTAGNSDQDGIVVGTAIVANGGTLKDDAENDATLVLNGVGSVTGVLVNDAPTVMVNTELTLDEDSAATGITNAKLQATDLEQGAEQLTFTVGTAPAKGVLKKSSTVLIDGSTFTQADINSSLITYTPNQNQNGSDSFTFTVSDGAGGIANGTFNITVNAVNDTPTLDTISNLTIDEDAGQQIVNLSGISAGGGETQTLTVTATSSDTALIPNPDVSYTSADATGTLTFTPAANANGTATITVTVTDDGGTANGGVDTYMRTFTVTVNAVSDKTGSTSQTQIIVDGNIKIDATTITTNKGDKTETTVKLDDKILEEKISAGKNNSTVVILVNTNADVVVGQLSGQLVKTMETKEVVLEIKTGNVIYTLPASEINIDAVSEQIGQQVKLKDIIVNVKIAEPPTDTVKIVEDTASKNNYQVVVKPVDFEITCTSGDKTVNVSGFNGYVERTIAIPDGIDPSKITTGIILNKDGTFSHVPTTIIVINGKYYAKINSLTNSTYSVIWSPKTFKDVENHWAKDAVNDMGSRLVIGGVGDDRFEPARDITRAEFSAIVVRALGIMRPGTGKSTFKDVTKDAWYYDAVSIAYEYGIISGYGNGKFGPSDRITREQAMTMIAKAMNITKLQVELANGEVEKILATFTDGGKAAGYAKTGIVACVKTGIISGKGSKMVAPKDNITRAEVAVIVRSLLKKSNLI